MILLCIYTSIFFLPFPNNENLFIICNYPSPLLITTSSQHLLSTTLGKFVTLPYIGGSFFPAIFPHRYQDYKTNKIVYQSKESKILSSFSPSLISQEKISFGLKRGEKILKMYYIGSMSHE